jgi:hypothetical protein
MIYLHLFLISCLVFPATDIPPLNKKVLEYLQQVIGHQVGSGECWDLAAAALDYSGAHLDRSSQESIYVFGRAYDPMGEVAYPGDIMQFKGVKLEYEKDNMIVLESMPHHTAIIYEVLGDRHFRIAHQNTRFSGRKVGVSTLHLDHVQSGTILFYRPVSGPQ